VDDPTATFTEVMVEAVILFLFLFGLLVAALPWWPYKLPPITAPGPLSTLPSLPDL